MKCSLQCKRNKHNHYDHFTCLSPIILSPSIILSQSNLSAIPWSNSAICSYFTGRKVPISKPNFSCSVPILQKQHCKWADTRSQVQNPIGQSINRNETKYDITSFSLTEDTWIYNLKSMHSAAVWDRLVRRVQQTLTDICLIVIDLRWICTCLVTEY